MKVTDGVGEGSHRDPSWRCRKNSGGLGNRSLLLKPTKSNDKKGAVIICTKPKMNRNVGGSEHTSKKLKMIRSCSVLPLQAAIELLDPPLHVFNFQGAG